MPLCCTGTVEHTEERVHHRRCELAPAVSSKFLLGFVPVKGAVIRALATRNTRSSVNERWSAQVRGGIEAATTPGTALVAN